MHVVKREENKDDANILSSQVIQFFPLIPYNKACIFSRDHMRGATFSMPSVFPPPTTKRNKMNDDFTLDMLGSTHCIQAY